MHRIVIAALGFAALAAPSLVFAMGGGEAGALEHARMNALAGGPTNARDAELLERYGCLSGTPSAFCHGHAYRRHLYRAHRAYR